MRAFLWQQRPEQVPYLRAESEPNNCLRTCKAGFHDVINGMALDWDRCHDSAFHEDSDREGYERMVGQSSGVKFSQYDLALFPDPFEILGSSSLKRCSFFRKHFGPDVFFSKTRIAKIERETWPRDIKHLHRCAGTRKTVDPRITPKPARDSVARRISSSSTSTTLLQVNNPPCS